jgi:hypothetical protein
MKIPAIFVMTSFKQGTCLLFLPDPNLNHCLDKDESFDCLS